MTGKTDQRIGNPNDPVTVALIRAIQPTRFIWDALKGK